jgi:hypothetical protein
MSLTIGALHAYSIQLVMIDFGILISQQKPSDRRNFKRTSFWICALKNAKFEHTEKINCCFYELRRVFQPPLYGLFWERSAKTWGN